MSSAERAEHLNSGKPWPTFEIDTSSWGPAEWEAARIRGEAITKELEAIFECKF